MTSFSRARAALYAGLSYLAPADTCDSFNFLLLDLPLSGARELLPDKRAGSLYTSGLGAPPLGDFVAPLLYRSGVSASGPPTPPLPLCPGE